VALLNVTDVSAIVTEAAARTGTAVLAGGIAVEEKPSIWTKHGDCSSGHSASATRNVAQHVLLHYSETMPVALAQKVRTLSVDFRSSARLADLLGVSRSQVTRWLRGAGIDPLNAEKVDLLELVWSNVLRIYDQDAALAWLFGVNPLLGDRRPVDLIRLGRTEELMRAIRAERSDTFA
jgi:uncharacterized protein (DUF2384 family)